MTDDVDKTWDGKCPLDEHREKELAKIDQLGFGKLKPFTVNKPTDLDPVKPPKSEKKTPKPPVE